MQILDVRGADVADILQSRSVPDITCKLLDVRGADVADILQSRSVPDLT